MLEAARQKREAEKGFNEIIDPGTENICIGCE